MSVILLEREDTAVRKTIRHKAAKLIKLKHQHYTGKQLREIRAKKGVGRPVS